MDNEDRGHDEEGDGVDNDNRGHDEEARERQEDDKGNHTCILWQNLNKPS